MAEETVNNKTFKALVEEQKKTTIAIRQQMMSAEEKSAEETLEREKSEEKYLKNQERGFKADATRLANLAKSTPTAAEAEETATENNSYLKNTFSKFLGKGSFLAGTLGGIGKSLKEKVTGGIEGIFKALKAGAFVAFLLGMAKFLESETFKDLKDKYLPVIAEGLTNLGKTLKSIFDGFFVKGEDGKYTFSATAGLKNIFSKIKLAFTDWAASLKAGFFDEEGNFQLLAGLKNAAGEFGKLAAVFAVGGLFMAALMPRTFFGTLWVGKKLLGGVLGVGGTVAKKFGKLFLSMTGLGTSLTDTGTAMDGKLASSKKTGVFRKGLRGLTGRFGRLFRFFGKRKGLAGLIIGAGVGMSALLTSNSGPDSIFAKIGTGFSNLFTKVGAFGAKIGTTVSGMATSLTNTTVFKTISSGFSSLFGVLSDFGTKIAATAAKAAAKVTKVAADAAASIAKIGSKVAKPAAKLSKTALDALRGTGEFAFKPKAKLKPTASKLTSVQRNAMSSMTGFTPNKSAAKLGTELSEAALKKSLLKTGFGVAGKAIPLVGAFLGLGLSAWRALKGDFVGATGEFAGIFAPSLVGLPLDLGLAARDIYYDQFGVYPEQEKDLKLAKSRMGQITSFLKKQKPKAEIKPNNSQSKPMQFNNSTGNNRSSNLVPNMAYDYNSDGAVSPGERRKAGRAGLPDGPAFINAPVTNINNTSNSNTSVMNRSLVMQDPLLRSAINAM